MADVTPTASEVVKGTQVKYYIDGVHIGAAKEAGITLNTVSETHSLQGTARTLTITGGTSGTIRIMGLHYKAELLNAAYTIPESSTTDGAMTPKVITKITQVWTNDSGTTETREFFGVNVTGLTINAPGLAYTEEATFGFEYMTLPEQT